MEIKIKQPIPFEQLSTEKQFTHTMFCLQIENIDRDSAKQLLTELHKLCLGQQAIALKLYKKDLTNIT